MKLVFAGTPAFAAAALEALIGAGHEVVLVLTQPDRPAGRGLQLQASAVKQSALAHAIPLIQPQGLRIAGRFDADARAAHESLLAPHDVMVVAAYGLILPASVLAMPPRGCLNIHASLLPRWRGAAPIQRAIEAGDAETGITIMQMDAGLDTGDLLLRRTIPISDVDTAGSLTASLTRLGASTIVEAVAALAAGKLVATPQHGPGDHAQATYAHKLSKSESPLDFAQATRRLLDRIRAFDPWPGCSAALVDETSSKVVPFKIWAATGGARTVNAAAGRVLGFDESAGGVEVATSDGTIVLTEVQKAGGKRVASQHYRSQWMGEKLSFIKDLSMPLPP